MRSQKEVDIMINKLERLRRRLPEFTIFNESNHVTIDGQIDVLKGDISDEDEIYDREEEFGESGMLALVDAYNWLHGEDISLVDEDDLKREILDGTEDEEIEGKACKKLKQCKECPFRKTSLPGYLGEASYDPITFLNTIEHEPLPCHMAVDWSVDGDAEKKQYSNPCVGSLKFLKNTAKMPIKKDYRDLRNKFEKDASCFTTKKDFIDHHSAK